MRFELGQVVATPGALEALARNGQMAIEFIRRHVTGDWGEAELAEDETKPNVRNRIKAAAKRRRLNVEFLRTKDEKIVRFRLIGNGELPLFSETEPGDEIFADTPLPQDEPF